TTLTLEFTQPADATGIKLYCSAEEPTGGVVSGGWVEIISATFGSGQVTAVISDADKDRTLYFRLEVTGGVNAGYSNTAGKQGASAVTPVYTENPPDNHIDNTTPDEDQPTGTDNVTDKMLQVTTNSTGMQITGLIPGEVFAIYNMQGQLVFRGKAAGTEAFIVLSGRGTYVVVTDRQALKAAY
ncbi:MAG: hypothetical protein LBB84_10975, partial [Tannerellaceae bacterium]|nr:hypothetical protein [Tannerellaceae bacterium]